MKNALHIFLLCTSFIVSAQVGIGTTTPDSSSILELESANAGFLMTRIELTGPTDVTTIPAPAEGLMVYNLSTSCAIGPGIYVFDGTQWRRLPYANTTSYTRLIRDEVGVSNVTFAPINATNSFASYPSLFDDVDNTGGASFHMDRTGSPAGDWGFSITLPKEYFITSLIFEGRNDCCTERIENIVVRLYRCGSEVYSSPAITSAVVDDNIVSIPDIYADEIRIVVPSGGGTGSGEGIINFSELEIVATD